MPKESQATGVTVQGSFAYLSVDSFTLNEDGDSPAFRGLIKFDLEKEQVYSEMIGLDPGAESISSDSQSLIVSWGQILWKYNLNTLSSSSGSQTLPEPSIRIWHFPIKGYPEGSAALDDVYYYTCFAVPNGTGDYKFKPLALSRKTLQIN